MINENVINEARSLIGSMLRNFRESKGLNQTQVADYIGVSKNTISKVEIGKFDFGIDIISKLSILYGFTINFEIKEEGDKNRFLLQESSEADNFIVTDTNNKIVCKFKKGNFNGTQNFTFLDAVPLNLPMIMREFGDWIAEFHGGLL